MELERVWDRLLIKMKMEQQDFSSFFIEHPLKLIRTCPSFTFLGYIRGVFEKYECGQLLEELTLIEAEMRNKTQIKLTRKIKPKNGCEIVHTSMGSLPKKSSSLKMESSVDTRTTRDTSGSGGKYKGEWNSLSNEEFNRKISVTNFVETALNENSNSTIREHLPAFNNQPRNKTPSFRENSPLNKYDKAPSDRRSQPILRDLDSIKIQRDDERKSDSASVVTDASSQFFLFTSQNENINLQNINKSTFLTRTQSQPIKLEKAVSKTELEDLGKDRNNIPYANKLESSLNFNGASIKSFFGSSASNNYSFSSQNSKKPMDNSKKSRSFGNSFSRKLVNLPNQKKPDAGWLRQQERDYSKGKNLKDAFKTIREEEDYIPCNLLTLDPRDGVLAWGTPVKSCKDSLSSDGDDHKIYKNLLFE